MLHMIRNHYRYLKKPGQYAGIDALRAIAVSAVVLFHFEIFKAGWIGVDLFFVLSGFLIGGLLLTAAERDGFV